MNKKTKLLSIFILAGVISTGVAVGVSGCKTHKHNWSEEYSVQENGKHAKTCDGCNKLLDEHDAEWTDDNDTTCDHDGCDVTRTVTTTPPAAGDYVVDAAVTALQIEGVTSETIQLNNTDKKSHTIDKSAIKVYFMKGTTKGDEVPAANLSLTLLDGSNKPVTSWENITLGGVYKVNAKLTGAKMAAGATVDIDDVIDTVTVTIVNNVAGIELKEGATLKQKASTTDSMTSTWKFQSVYQNGDKKDLTASEVEIGALNTSDVTDENGRTVTVKIKGTEISTTVTYVIEVNENLRIQSYAYNFGFDEHDGAYDDDTYIIDNKGDHTGSYVMIPGSKVAPEDTEDGKGKAANGVKMEQNKPRESTDGEKYFLNRLTFGGGTFTSSGTIDSAAEKKKYIVINAESAGKLTLYWSRNSSNDTRGIALWTKAQWEAGINVGQNASAANGFSLDSLNPVGSAYNKNTTGKETDPELATFTIPAAGTYYLTTATNQAAYLYYIQIDNEYNDATKDNVTVQDGDKIYAAIAKSHSSDETGNPYVQEFNLGATFTVDSGYTFKATSAAKNTGKLFPDETIAVSDLTFKINGTTVTPGQTVLDSTLIPQTGTITVTVEYHDVSTTYTIKVSNALGIDSVTATLKSTVKTVVDNDDDKVNVKLTDFDLTPVGDNKNEPTLEVNVTAGTYKTKDAEGAGTAIDAANGADLAIGQYVITLTVHVKLGTNEDDFTATVNVAITKKPEAGALTASSINFNGLVEASTDGIAVDTPLTASNITGTSVTSAKIVISGESNTYHLRTCNETVDGENVTVMFHTKGSCSAVGDNDIAKRWLELTLAKAGTYNISVWAKSGGTGDRFVVMHSGASGAKVIGGDNLTQDGITETTFSNIACGTTVKIAAGGNAIQIYKVVITPVSTGDNTPGETASIDIKADDYSDGVSIKDEAKKITVNNKYDFYSGGSGDTKTATCTQGTIKTADEKVSFTKGWLPGGNGREFYVVAKANITLTIYFTISNADWSAAEKTEAFTKSGDLEWTITPSGGVAGEKVTDDTNSGDKNSTTAYKVEISLNEGDTLTLTASANRAIILALYGEVSA